MASLIRGAYGTYCEWTDKRESRSTAVGDLGNFKSVSSVYGEAVAVVVIHLSFRSRGRAGELKVVLRCGFGQVFDDVRGSLGSLRPQVDGTNWLVDWLVDRVVQCNR